MSLLNIYILSERLKFKREIIQRKIIFSEPVYGLSLSSILSDDQIERKKEHTDKSREISELGFLDKNQIDMFETSWYLNLSDIRKDNIYYINKEIDLPWNAIKEINSVANDEYNLKLLPRDNVIETVKREESINKLLNCKPWIILIFMEYTIKKFFYYKLRDLLRSADVKSKKYLIKNIYDRKKNARNNTNLMSDIFNASESYIKDIINNRVKYGLSDSEREDILERDNYECQNCQSDSNLEVHHIIPISDGGNKDDNNLCTLCFDCHFNIAHKNSTSTINYNTKEEFWELIDN